MGDDANTRHYQHLLETHTKVAEAYPKVVLLLSGGALALSVTFLERFTGGKAPAATMALWIGWLGLAGSLLSIVTSMLISLGLLELVSKPLMGSMSALGCRATHAAVHEKDIHG